MADERSPWARPDTRVEVSAAPATPAHAPVPRGAPPDGAGPSRSAIATLARAGAVTRLNEPRPPDVLQNGPDDDDPIRRNKLMMRWFGAAAGVVVIIGLVVALAMVMTGSAGRGGPDLLDRDAAPPPDTRPELVKNCPPPTAYPQAEAPPPTPPGPRTTDEESGISYKAYGVPWEPWPAVWVGGTLNVAYKTGQHFVTETYSSGDYHASILSASVPATVNDALAIDLKCTGRQVAADVRTEYYPQPNRLEQLAEEETRLGGRPAWLTKFRLHFDQRDLDAKSELVGLALIDVGRPQAAIIYVSIPDTHRQFDLVVDEVLDSVRPV